MRDSEKKKQMGTCKGHFADSRIGDAGSAGMSQFRDLRRVFHAASRACRTSCHQAACAGRQFVAYRPCQTGTDIAPHSWALLGVPFPCAAVGQLCTEKRRHTGWFQGKTVAVYRRYEAVSGIACTYFRYAGTFARADRFIVHFSSDTANRSGDRKRQKRDRDGFVVEDHGAVDSCG